MAVHGVSGFLLFLKPAGLMGIDAFINPYLFYGAVVLGGLGIAMALPRGGKTAQIVGAVIAALAGGLVLFGMGIKSVASLPNIYFYIFSAIGLGAALRVISHPRPVYAALYFILTVLASGGLFLLLSAEFMAMALIIVYAGAILITYLFVIMLATQAPTEDRPEELAEYDTSAREPIAATTAGFVLLAVLTTLAFNGTSTLNPPPPGNADSVLVQIPRKVERVLRGYKLIENDEKVDGFNRVSGDGVAAIESVIVKNAEGKVREIAREAWPEELRVRNVEQLGLNLLQDHPGSIEIAGVILLMAMLGAVVLSRRQVQIDEDAKRRHSQTLAETASQVGGTPGGAA
ncbi:MAG: NADH-quinone oxidoreductase subunit J [Phycisphaerae bacterium]|nr:NADH-quinone oxidoreductase subunit J [Phycisphaerae bacterium]